MKVLVYIYVVILDLTMGFVSFLVLQSCHWGRDSWHWRYTTFSCSTQWSIKIILLINVKIPTIVGIIILISMIKTTSEWLKARNFFICWYFSCMSSCNFTLSWVEQENSFITCGLIALLLLHSCFFVYVSIYLCSSVS